jgi:hypothetical protein
MLSASTKSFSEKDIATAMNVISHRSLSETDVGFTCPELQTFVKRIRHVKGEFTNALLNKMFYAATPRSVMALDELVNALSSVEFGYSWAHVIGEALRASTKPRPAKPQREDVSPRREGLAASTHTSGESPRRQPTYVSPRRIAIQNVVDAAQSTKKLAALQQQEAEHSETAFPSWSVHARDQYNDAFDNMRVDHNGVSLEAARAKEKELQREQLKRIHPNTYGAVVVPRSPRNEGYAVVVVDATAEKERMRRALHRQAELKKLLAQGGASVQKYLRNEHFLDDPTESIHPRDLAYRNTMTSIVDYLSSAPSSPRGV